MKDGNMLYIYIPCIVFGPPVDMKTLQSELHSVQHKWYRFGVQLQVSINTLKCIKRENSTMDECLLKMLIIWLKDTDSPPTLNILTEALESPPVGERTLAQQLRDKYCSGTELDVIHDDPTQQPLLPGVISQGSYLNYIVPMDYTIS